MSFRHIRLDSQILKARLEFLQNKALKLCEDYDLIMSRLNHLETEHESLSELVDHEEELMGVVELFMQDDVRACTVLDYVIVFFRLVLAKMRHRGHDFDDVKQLYHALSDEDVAQTFRTVLSKLAFPAPEQRALRIILEALQHHKWPKTEVMTSSPGGDAQISTALLYLRLQQDLTPTLNSSLQRALCTAHECVVSDMAISEVSCDININANDVIRKDDDVYAYAFFPREGEQSGFDESVTSEPNRSRARKARKAVCEYRNALEPSPAPEAREQDHQGLENRSSTLAMPEGDDLELRDTCVAFARACSISSHAAWNDTPHQPTSSTRSDDIGDKNYSCLASPTHDHSNQSDLEEPGPLDPDGTRFAPDTRFYVICYDADTWQGDRTSEEREESDVILRQDADTGKLFGDKGISNQAEEDGERVRMSTEIEVMQESSRKEERIRCLETSLF